MITIHKAQPTEYPAIQQFYRDRQYAGSLNESAIVFVALEDEQIVGVAQLCQEDGYCALRGMQVHGDVQGQGIGSRLLQQVAAAIDRQSCYCIPWSHLEQFYQRIGFERITTDAAPKEVGDRYTHYLSQGLDVILMQRSVEDGV
jgi:N-acetylglutamate synthase-like GNAT family acetyltransferase